MKQPKVMSAVWAAGCLWAGGAWAQTETPAAPAGTTEERAVKAAEAAAAAAERAAVALEKMALAQEEKKSEASPTKKPEEPVDAWTGSVGLGLISLTGNASSITVSGNSAFQYKGEHWIFSNKSSFVYGQSRPADRATPSEVVALAAGTQLQGDRRITQMLSAFVGAGIDTDHVKSIEIRGFGEAGVGIIWLDVSEGDLQKSFLRTDLGIRYGEESRFQYYPTQLDLPDVTLVAPRAAVSFRYALSKDVSFQQDAEVLTNIIDESRFLLNTLTKVSARLVGSLSLGVGFVVKHDSNPAPGKLETDTALTVGVEMAF